MKSCNFNKMLDHNHLGIRVVFINNCKIICKKNKILSESKQRKTKLKTNNRKNYNKAKINIILAIFKKSSILIQLQQIFNKILQIKLIR